MPDDRQPYAGTPGGTRPAPGPNGRLEWSAPAVASNVGVLRSDLVAFAGRHGAGGPLKDDVALATSEALANAVMHGYVGGTPGTLHVIAEHADGRLVVRVIDDGRGPGPRGDSPGMGLGTALMTTLTTQLVIGPGSGGKGTETRLTFALAAVAPAS